MLIKSEPFHAHLPASKWPFHFLLGGHLPSYLRQIIRSLVDPYKVVAMRILKTNWMLWGSNCQVDVDAISWPVIESSTPIGWIKTMDSMPNSQWCAWKSYDGSVGNIMTLAKLCFDYDSPNDSRRNDVFAPDPTWGLNFWTFKIRTQGRWMIWSCWRMRPTVVGRLDEPVFYHHQWMGRGGLDILGIGPADWKIPFW